MLVPELECYWTAAGTDLERWTPASLADGQQVINLDIRAIGHRAVFSVTVATPEALRREREAQPAAAPSCFTGRHHIIVLQWNWPEILAYLKSLIADCAGETWAEVKVQLWRCFGGAQTDAIFEQILSQRGYKHPDQEGTTRLALRFTKRSQSAGQEDVSTTNWLPRGLTLRTHPSSNSQESVLTVSLPAGIVGRPALLQLLVDRLKPKGPGHFSYSWDTVWSLLVDCRWADIPRKIIIVHEALPAGLGAAELQTYLRLLNDAVVECHSERLFEHARTYGLPIHELEVTFPPECRAEIERLLQVVAS